MKKTDKNVRKQTVIKVGQEVFSDDPLQVVFLSDDSEKMAGRMYKNLVQKSIDPYKVLKVCPNMTVFDEDGIPNHMSNNGVNQYCKNKMTTYHLLLLKI